MIMPCINSTAACDRGGRVALVDGGSVLLGLPRAPGCTTTGFAASPCCAHAPEQKRPPEQKKLAGTLAASNTPRSTADTPAERHFRRRRKRENSRFDASASPETELDIIFASLPIPFPPPSFLFKYD